MKFLLPLLLMASLSGKAAAQLPGSLGFEVNPTNGHIYHILEESTWTDAQLAAAAMGGSLVTINDQIENDWIFGTFGYWGNQSRDLWIGYNDITVEGTFEWADGDTSLYTNWAFGQPDNYSGNDPVNGEDHVHMYGFNSPYGPGEWNDMHDALPGSAGWTFGMYGIVELEQPIYSITNLVAGGTATFAVSNATPNSPILIGFTRAGAGPVMTPYGMVDMSFPITPLPVVTTGANGSVDFQMGIPAGTTGVTIYTQGVDLTSGVLTNSLAEVIQ
jgi:hypothetical protein